MSTGTQSRSTPPMTSVNAWLGAGGSRSNLTTTPYKRHAYSCPHDGLAGGLLGPAELWTFLGCLGRSAKEAEHAGLYDRPVRPRYVSAGAEHPRDVFDRARCGPSAR